MLTLNRKQQRLPYGGHQFPESGLTITGDSYDEVVQKLTDFRLSNGKPVGSPAMDVLLYYARVCPYMVIDDLKPGLESPINEIYPLWRDSISRMWNNPQSSGLTTKEATTRWDVCRLCPKNRPKDWKETAEAQEAARRAYLLRKGETIPADIGFCTCHRADIGILSYFEKPKQASDKKDSEVQPIECWVI